MRLARPALLNLRAVGVSVTFGGLAAAPVLQADERVGCTVACATAGDLYGSLVGIVHHILIVSFSLSDHLNPATHDHQKSGQRNSGKSRRFRPRPTLYIPCSPGPSLRLCLRANCMLENGSRPSEASRREALTRSPACSIK